MTQAQKTKRTTKKSNNEVDWGLVESVRQSLKEASEGKLIRVV